MIWLKLINKYLISWNLMMNAPTRFSTLVSSRLSLKLNNSTRTKRFSALHPVIQLRHHFDRHLSCDAAFPDIKNDMQEELETSSTQTTSDNLASTTSVSYNPYNELVKFSRFRRGGGAQRP